MKSGSQIPWNTVTICEMSKTSWQRSGESIEGPSYPSGTLVRYFPKLREKQSTNSSIWKKLLWWIPLIVFVRGENLGRRYSDHWWWKIGKEVIDEARNKRIKLHISEDWMRKEVLITQKDEEFVCPLADDSAKLTGRDYEFQEPTLRRESTVRRENLSGESHGDREEFQPEEIKRWRRNQ